MSEGKRSLQIVDPCPASWDLMRGTAGRRHCDTCDKAVYNLSEMTPEAAAEVLERSEPVCVRVRCSADGTVLHSAAPARSGANPRLQLLLTPALLAAMAACRAPADADLPLVVEGPPASAAPARVVSPVPAPAAEQSAPVPSAPVASAEPTPPNIEPLQNKAPLEVAAAEMAAARVTGSKRERADANTVIAKKRGGVEPSRSHRTGPICGNAIPGFMRIVACDIGIWSGAACAGLPPPSLEPPFRAGHSKPHRGQAARSRVTLLPPKPHGTVEHPEHPRPDWLLERDLRPQQDNLAVSECMGLCILE